MATLFNTDYLLAQTKLYAALPAGKYTDQEILAVAYDELISNVVPMVINLREEFYVQSADQNITANVSAYPIPVASLGLAVREIKIVRSNRIVDVPRMSPTDVISTQTGLPRYFYLQGNNIILYPTPSSTVDVLRVTYYGTPEKLVVTTEARLVTSISATLSSDGLVFCSSSDTQALGWVYDGFAENPITLSVYSGDNGHVTKGTALRNSSVSAGNLNFSGASLTAIVAAAPLRGDWFAKDGETPLVQAPDVCFDFLCRMTAGELLQAMGDSNGYRVNSEKVKMVHDSVASMLTNRTLGALKKSRISIL